MGISSALGSSALLPAGLGFRNKIMNGDFRINQRGSATYTGTTPIQYTLDRWWTYTTSGTVTFSQSNSVVPPGFSTSMAVSVTTGGTYSSGGNYCLLGQTIEAGNITDLSWGGASAKPVTLSFWVRSSITGTYGVALQNAGYQTQVYVATYTVNSANTWEYKTILVPGSTTGTWNGITNTSFTSGGMIVGFSLGVDTNFQAATPNVWQYGAAYGTASTVDLAATTGATFYVTGVQVEQNYQPTPFEQRPIGVELALCQRYYQTYVDPPLRGVADSTTRPTRMGMVFPVPMRVAPTMPPTISGTLSFFDGGTVGNYVSIHNSWAKNTHVEFDFNLTAGFTQGRGAVLYQGGNGSMSFSAEL